MSNIDRRRFLASAGIAATTGYAAASGSAAADPGTRTAGGADRRHALGCGPREASDSDAEVRTDGTGGTSPDRATIGDDATEEPRIEFLDCETVRVVGDVADVIVGTVFWDEFGALGNTQEPVGGVDGERVFHVPSIYGRSAAGPVVTYAEVFEEGTAVVPGNGDVSARNPDYDSCEESALASLEGEDDVDGEGTDSQDANPEEADDEASDDGDTETNTDGTETDGDGEGSEDEEANASAAGEASDGPTPSDGNATADDATTADGDSRAGNASSDDNGSTDEDSTTDENAGVEDSIDENRSAPSVVSNAGSRLAGALGGICGAAGAAGYVSSTDAG